MSAWEHDPEGRIEGNLVVREGSEAEQMLIDTFEALSDTVDAIPVNLVESIGRLRTKKGAKRYDEIVTESVQTIGVQTWPRNATEFIAWLLRTTPSFDCY